MTALIDPKDVRVLFKDLPTDPASMRAVMPAGASCVVLRGDDEVLACSRRDNPNIWGFPGGKVDTAESPMQSGLRELFEECSIQACAVPTFIYEGVCTREDEPMASNSTPYWVYVYLVRIAPDAQPFAPPGEPECKFMKISDFLKYSAFPRFNQHVMGLLGLNVPKQKILP